MSREFIENRIGSSSLAEAQRQQKQLSYFTEGSIQQPINKQYIKAFIERNFTTDDEHLNWIKTIFGDKNFLSYYKYLRNPVPSASVVNNKIKPQLQRVFHSEDSFFNYTVRGQKVEEPEELQSAVFNDWILDALLFRFNDILVNDLSDINTPTRYLISIHNVVALRSVHSVIKQIAYTAKLDVVAESGELKTLKGYLYIDDEAYIFYDDDYNEVKNVPHDLGECPADYISPEPFKDDDIVRKGWFSFMYGKLEYYSFLKTLERMVLPNGGIPTTATLKFRDNEDDEEDVDSLDDEPNNPMAISSQGAKYQREVSGKANESQAGINFDVEARLKDDGSIDSVAVQNFIKHFYMPPESLNMLRERILEDENDIIQSATGDFKEQNEAAQNEKQVSKGYMSKQDVLRSVSKAISRIRKLSDRKMLSLKYGAESVDVQVFYGSDHFQETQDELFNLLEKAKNPIERKKILIRISDNKFRFNPEKRLENRILYNLMPYVHDDDFKTAIDVGMVSTPDFHYQTRFNYWVGLFEAKYDSVVNFWQAMEGRSDSEKYTFIDQLIRNIINESEVVEPQKVETNTNT